MIWKAKAPSNIALIKYMGKEGANMAVNPSLSMTLQDFCTSVELEISSKNHDHWAPLKGSHPLRAESTKKFVDFFTRIKKEKGISQNFLLRSGNNFPSDAGLASSASSFAALTMAAMQAFSELSKKPLPSPLEMANVSRTGSGSSCRSFFSPWCRWEGEQVEKIETKLPALIDLVAVVDGGYKKVSSSEAHKRVQSSALFNGRVARASARLAKMEAAMKTGAFQTVANLSWEELWDMHSLFHTAVPPFFYFAPETISVLRAVENFWEAKGRGPITTIDAGPNVHLLVPEEMRAEMQSLLKTIPGITIMESRA